MDFWKLTFSKLEFYWKEDLKTCTTFEEQKGAKYIWGNICFGIIVFSCLSSTKLCLRFLLICFAQEVKRFYQSSLGNEVDFRDIMNVSPNILGKNWNFEKRFCRWKSTDNNDINILPLKNSCTFFPAKEKTWKGIFNTNSELLQNCAEKKNYAIQNNSKLAT